MDSLPGIINGLVAHDRHTRKLAKHALMTSITGACTQCTWERFWTIYDSADEYSGHLFKSVFSDTVNLSWCTTPTENACLTTQLVAVIIHRVLTHENDHVVKFALTELALNPGFQSFVTHKKILDMSVFLQALEQSPSMIVKREDSTRISKFISNCLNDMCFDIHMFLLHVLTRAKLFYPVIHCYLAAFASIPDISVDGSTLRAAKVFVLRRISAFPTFLRPALIRSIRDVFFAKSCVVESDENFHEYFTLLSSVHAEGAVYRAKLRGAARDYALKHILSETPLSFEAIKGISHVIGAQDPEMKEFISNAVLDIANRQYAPQALRENVLFAAIAFAAGLDRALISSMVEFDGDQALIPCMVKLLQAGASICLDDLKLHHSKLREFILKKNLSDKEKFDFVVSLMVTASANITPELQDIVHLLFSFTLDRVHPEFDLPRSLSDRFVRIDSRDGLHAEFFRFKFLLLKRVVETFGGDKLFFSSSELLEQYSGDASMFLTELNEFSLRLLERGLLDDPTRFLAAFPDICLEYLSNRNAQLNTDIAIQTTLEIAFFDAAAEFEGRTKLMRNLLRIAEHNHPLIGRHSVPLFLGFFKRVAISVSDEMLEIICDLITHKEGFDETQIEGFEFGKTWNRNKKLNNSVPPEIEATSAYTRILTLVVLRELGGEGVAIIQRIVRNLVCRILNAQEEIIKKQSPQTPLPFTALHRSQLRIYQALCYLAPLITETCFKADLENILFGPLLQWANQPDARDYLETLAIYFIARFRRSLRPLISVLKNYSLPSQSLASFVLIGGHALTLDGLEVYEKRQLALHLLPYLSSNVSYIRGISQQWLQKAHDVGILGELQLNNPVIENMISFMNENRESIQLRQKLTPVYSFWDPIHAIDSGEIIALCPSGAMFKNSELVPCVVYMDAIRNGVHEAMKDNWFFTRDFETVIDDYSRSLEMKNSVTVEENNEISNSQRKYIPQIGSLFPGIEPNQSRRKVRQLIVVASLVDKTTNIAGLCRSAEVFGAQRLVVPSMSILKEAQFSAMSVTAEQWIDVEEFPETRLAGYLSNMKSSGYTVVCLEQTHDSVEIQNFKFPEKCCLVLGNEKSGVPVHFLPCMDVCVEIPQRGVIRSLNVHVSGAIAMWQYNQCR